MIVNKVLFYTFGKAIELGGLAFLLFFVASQVKPEEYALLMPYLLAISISTMIYSGFGGSFVKQYSLNEDKVFIFKQFLSQSLLIAIFTASIIVFLFDEAEFLAFLLISIFANSFRSFGQSTYRALIDEKSLVRFNFIYPVVCISFFAVLSSSTHFNSVKVYIISSALGLLGSALYVIIKYILPTKLSFSFKLAHWKLPFNHLILNLAIFLIVTIDKFIVLRLETADFIGAYQLYENFSNLFYMGVSSVLYLLTPYLLQKLKKNKGILKIRYQVCFVSFMFIVTLIYWLLCIFVLEIYYKEYVDFTNVFFLQLVIKLSAILMYLPSIYYMYKNKETRFSLTLYFTLFCFAGVASFLILGLGETDTYTLLFSLALMIFFSAIVLNVNIVRDRVK